MTDIAPGHAFVWAERAANVILWSWPGERVNAVHSHLKAGVMVVAVHPIAVDPSAPSFWLSIVNSDPITIILIGDDYGLILLSLRG